MRIILGFFVLLPLAFGQTPQLFGFLPNTGQFPPAVQFVRPDSNNVFYLTRDSFVLFNTLRIQISGIDPNATPVGDSPLPTRYNFYQSRNPSRWTTGAQLFAAVRLSGVYPGVNATITTTALTVPGSPVGQGVITFTIAPGADPSPIRVRVLNTGAVPTTGPGGIWFTGGNVPGVFIVAAQAKQVSGSVATAAACSLAIESADTLSIQLPDRDPALETDVAVTFPDYDLLSASKPAPGFLASTIRTPTSFGADGSLPASPCGNTCQNAVVASIDANGNPVWVTVFGGSGSEQNSLATAFDGGVSVSGGTSSNDFPVTASAPYASPGSPQDVYLAYFDGAQGLLRSSTYAGLPGMAYAAQQITGPSGDVAVAGAYTLNSATQGYILRWQPAQNHFLYSLTYPSRVAGIAFDPTADLYYALLPDLDAAATITAGEVDASGKPVGTAVSISMPAGTQSTLPVLLPAGNNQLWMAYQAWPDSGTFGPSVWVARISPLLGQAAVNSRVASQGAATAIAMTPSGNLKLLVSGTSPTETTTPDAPVVASCPGTLYFLVLTPAGQLLYATYVPASGFDFSTQNESTGPPPALVSCFAGTAGRQPTGYAAPGEIITITGGGFGPANPVYTSPGADGKYPLAAGGFSVRIDGLDAPVIAIARGLIAVQVPYETAPLNPLAPLAIETSQNGTPLNSVPLSVTSYVLNLFDTGDRNNSIGLPALAALNQDGTVNSAGNPAAAGSVVSLFGSGAGALSPALETGALSPVPPAGPLSVSSLYRACWGCSEILYLGSAPGLSSGVVQLNVRIPGNAPGSGVRPQGIGIGVSQIQKSLFVSGPSGVVFIR